MGKNILDLSNIDSWDLVDELKNRGFSTNLLWCRDDVQKQLDEANEDRTEKIILTDEDKDNILDELSYEHCIRLLNDEIYDKILNY